MSGRALPAGAAGSASRLGRLRALVRPEPSGTATIAKRRMQVALLVLLVLLAAVLAVGVWAAASLYRSGENRYIGVVFPLQASVRQVVLGMVQEETGVRGYMITADRQSLAPYFDGRRKVEANLGRTGRLTRDRPQLAARLAVLRREITSLQGYYDRLITFVADGQVGRERARAEVLANDREFARFTSTARQIQDAIGAFVEETRAGQRATFLRSVGTLGVAGFFALAIAATLLVGFPERLRRLYRAEEDARLTAEQGANAARALTHVSDAVVLVDSGGRVRSWNPAAERLFRLPVGHALSRPALEAVAGYERLLAAGDELVPVEIEGEERWLAVSVSRFDDGHVLAVRDVTEAYALERARTDFIATASHELRTPLTAVYGAARTLLERDDLDDDRRQSLLRIVGLEAAQLARIVDQMLLTARLAGGGPISQSARPCDLRTLGETVLASAEARQHEGIALAFTAPTDLQPILCDEGLLRQVLANLVENAIKYSPEGGRVELRVLDEGDAVRIEVRDEGLGIAPSEQERIFEKFYRLDADMSRGVGGSGLGLYITREIVTAMGGRISVESTPGEGSTFAVVLPRAPVA